MIPFLTPREFRTIQALTNEPLMREALDRIAHASNGPEIISSLRKKGFEIPCERLKIIDYDGKTSRPGRYSLSESDKDLANKILKSK